MSKRYIFMIKMVLSKECICSYENEGISKVTDIPYRNYLINGWVVTTSISL